MNIHNSIRMFFLLLPFVGMSVVVSAQVADSVNLSNYAPSITCQVDPNCYAYAGAYVALTTQINAAKNIKSDCTTSFSLGFVDGAYAYLRKTYGMRRLKNMVADDLYEGDVGSVGNVDYTFYILKTYGTTIFNQFPYTTIKKATKNFKKEMLNDPSLQKIKSVKEIFSPASKFNIELFETIKQELRLGRPIVCAINQPEVICKWDDSKGFKEKAKTTGNHIVTILGFDAKGRIIVKNNYEKICVYRYKWEDIAKILVWGYTYEL